ESMRVLDEAVGAARSVQRREHGRRRQAERIGRPVERLDERETAGRRRIEQRAQILRHDARHVRVDDEHRAVRTVREAGDHGGAGASGPDNAAIAGRLEAFAGLLDLAGSGYYTTRAYRRAAELIRSTPAPVAELVREGRARELRGIGPGIEARLKELVETGTI